MALSDFNDSDEAFIRFASTALLLSTFNLNRGTCTPGSPVVLINLSQHGAIPFVCGHRIGLDALRLLV